MNDFGIPNMNMAHTFVKILGRCFYLRVENTPFYNLRLGGEKYI